MREEQVKEALKGDRRGFLNLTQKERIKLNRRVMPKSIRHQFNPALDSFFLSLSDNERGAGLSVIELEINIH